MSVQSRPASSSASKMASAPRSTSDLSGNIPKGVIPTPIMASSLIRDFLHTSSANLGFSGHKFPGQDIITLFVLVHPFHYHFHGHTYLQIFDLAFCHHVDDPNTFRQLHKCYCIRSKGLWVIIRG